MQLTTDGLKMYLAAFADGFGSYVDYAMPTKAYGNLDTEKRYSQAVCDGCIKQPKIASADEKRISAGYIVRQVSKFLNVGMSP